MQKVLDFVKPYAEDALDFVLDLLKSGAKAAGKFMKNVTVKTGKKVGDKVLGAAAPVCKIVMFAAAGVAVLSGVIWFFGRKK